MYVSFIVKVTTEQAMQQRTDRSCLRPEGLHFEHVGGMLHALSRAYQFMLTCIAQSLPLLSTKVFRFWPSWACAFE